MRTAEEGACEPGLIAGDGLVARSPDVDRPSREAAGRSSVREDADEVPFGEDLEDPPDGRLRPRTFAGSPRDGTCEPEPDDFDDPAPEPPEPEGPELEDPELEPEDFDEPEPEEPEDFDDPELEDPEPEPDDPELDALDEDPEGDLRPRTFAGSPPEALAGEAWLAGAFFADAGDDEDELLEESSLLLLDDLGA